MNGYKKSVLAWCVLGATALVALLAMSASANSTTVSYQGMLRDATMMPVPDNTYPMRFSIWDAPGGDTMRWGPETHPEVQTKNGMFSVYLGSNVALGDVFATYGALWLQVEADTGAGLEVYNPRVPLASVPYAQYAASAGNADTLDSQHASAFAPQSHNHAAAQITSGTLSTDRYSAYSDLSAESKIGAASNQVAQGNHTHALNNLSNVNVPSPGSGDVLSWSGAQWQATPSAASSGVSELYWSGWIAGNEELSVGFTCANQSSVLITCCMNHWGQIKAYGCARMSFVGIGPSIDNPNHVVDIENVQSANGGSWTFTWVSPTQLTITKTAGTYAGTGFYFIKVEGASGLAKL